MVRKGIEIDVTMPGYTGMLQVLRGLPDNARNPMESSRLKRVAQESMLMRGPEKEALIKYRGMVIDVDGTICVNTEMFLSLDHALLT